MFGNICGTFPADFSKNKTLVTGSHTDSVKNGGQFDGPVGVYMSLKSAENFKNSSKKQYGNLKTIIYACEESERFHKACLGSFYLSGELSYEQLANLTDENGITFADAVAEYKDYIFSHLAEYGIDLNNIELVDKVISEADITEAIEAHIEQSEILSASDIPIGIVDSIGKPLRGTISVSGNTPIVTSAKIISYLNELSLKSKTDDAEESLRITVPQFDTKSTLDNAELVTSDGSDLLKIRAIGETNHSGATPMDKRKDAVLGMSSLILKLDELSKQNPNIHFDFLGSVSEKWGANQIPNNSNLILRVTPSASAGIVKSFAEEIEEDGKVSFEISPTTWEIVQANPFTKLFVDIRQQYPAKGIHTRETVYDMFKDILHQDSAKSDSISFKISSIGDPVPTSSELLDNVKEICQEKKYPCQVMHSWPGHDLACVLSNKNKTGKKILFFIPSEGGSHNPKEITSKEAILIGTDVYTTLVSQRMNKFKEEYEKNSDLSL
ncbi:MAG: M20 family metallo-hydrolase [Clostridia bacterium]|nr:M20 family metallo-hydrolase [Clostridia bacterium]